MLCSEPETSVPIRYAADPHLWLEVNVPFSETPGFVWEVEEEGTPLEIEMLIGRRRLCAAGWAQFLRLTDEISLPRRYRVVTPMDELMPKMQLLQLGMGVQRSYHYIKPRNERTADWLWEELKSFPCGPRVVEPGRPVFVRQAIFGPLLESYERERCLVRP
jgi:hypothetical protein